MRVHAPGKLILSGEHAVVYGQPALAMAINRYAIATARPQLLPFISFDLSDLGYERKFTLNALDQLKNRIKQKYLRFIAGEFKIREVLHKPVELAQFVLSLFIESLNLKLTHGLKICVQSDIPMGCGMGSSAATILSIVHAIAHYFETPHSSDLFYRLGLEAENMQHGHSSGLDLKVSMQGGCILMKEGRTYSRLVPNLPMYLVNTGTPDASTGECVEQASQYFRTGNLGQDFATVTCEMDQALQNNNVKLMQDVIKENHNLLVKIGVVPPKVQQFIEDINKIQSAAKICGAGSISGDKAGIVLVVTDDINQLKIICAKYHYSILPIMGEKRGVHVL